MLQTLDNIIDCKNCEFLHKCCGPKHSVTLTKDEISKFNHTKIVPLTENYVILGYVAVLDKKENGFCVYNNDETKLCEIYEDRPSACRKFTCMRV